jgi:hypothetical protein
MRSLGDDGRRGRHVETRVEGGTRRAGDTVWRPPATARLEGAVVGRMPVTGEEDGQPFRAPASNVLVQGRDHFVAVRDRKRATRKEIALHVDDDERIPRADVDE